MQWPKQFWLLHFLKQCELRPVGGPGLVMGRRLTILGYYTLQMASEGLRIALRRSQNPKFSGISVVCILGQMLDTYIHIYMYTYILIHRALALVKKWRGHVSE